MLHNDDTIEVRFRSDSLERKFLLDFPDYLRPVPHREYRYTSMISAIVIKITIVISNLDDVYCSPSSHRPFNAKPRISFLNRFV